MDTEHFDPLDQGFGFLIETEDATGYLASLFVREITATDLDGKPCETEAYLSCTIKWDGCSHFNFGDGGYLHLCGGEYFFLHCALMRRLFEKAFEVMGREPDSLAGGDYIKGITCEPR